MKKSVAILTIGFALFGFWYAVWFYYRIEFAKEVEEPLVLAANARSTAECQKHLGKAVSYLVKQGFMKTNEHLFVDAYGSGLPPIQAWFNNLVEIQTALAKSSLPENAGNEATLLMLIRDRLLVDQDGEKKLLLPSAYPKTLTMFWWCWGSIGIIALGFTLRVNHR